MLNISTLSCDIAGSRILDHVDLQVRSGEKVGIIGPNGSGKTTLFNCICGFNIASSGTIHFAGRDITHARPSTRAKLGLGRVFQNFGIFRDMTLEENLLLALESKQGGFFLPWSKRYKANRAEAAEYLASVSLEKKAQDKAGSLSGGQMRLLEIVRAIAFGADLFLLDEPTAGVSPKMKQEIEGALARLQALNKTILIIEHDINFIQQLCQRILVLDGGRIVLDGTPETVRSDPRLQEIYFGANGKGRQAPAERLTAAAVGADLRSEAANA